MDAKKQLMLEASGLISRAYEEGRRDANKENSLNDYDIVPTLEEKILLCLKTHYGEISTPELAAEICVPHEATLANSIGKLAECKHIICNREGRWRYNWEQHSLR